MHMKIWSSEVMSEDMARVFSAAACGAVLGAEVGAIIGCIVAVALGFLIMRPCGAEGAIRQRLATEARS